MLFEMGIHNIYPDDIDCLPGDCQYQIFIHESNVKDIENLPNLYNLKVILKVDLIFYFIVLLLNL